MNKKQKEESYAKHWLERIRKACEYYDQWESKYKCRILEKYLDGSVSTAAGGTELSYYLNLFFSSTKVKSPSLCFNRPSYSLTPKPWKLDFNPEVAMTTARLKEDTLNSFIQESSLNFAEEIKMCLLDSWSYFGVMEVGYAANWIQNPNAGKPILKADYFDEESGDDPGDTLKEPDEIPEKEYVYFKRIPAHRFRVGGSDSHNTERNNWVGYYEFVRTDDLLANKKYLDNLDEKDWPSGRSDDYYADFAGPEDEKNFTSNGDYTKIWKIWDIRAKVKCIILATPEKCIYKEPFKRLPIFGLRFDYKRTGWYPVPVTFNWKSPQDEINESRNQMRNHRRRVRQMWQAMEQTVDPDEIDKFVHGPDATVIFVKRDQAIQPINNAPLDSSIVQSLQVSTDDFDKIAGTSNPQRGVSDRTTATEATTIENRARVREDLEREVVAEWLCNIGREVLLTIIEKFTEPFWIKLNRDMGEPGEEVQDLQQRYQLVHSAMLEDSTDFELEASVTSLSPVTNEVEKKKFLEFMSILQNFPIMSLHPTIIREAAYRCDYRNEQVIRAMQQMAQLSMMAKANEGQQNLANQEGQPKESQGEQSNYAQAKVAQMTPPQQEEIRQQMANQVQ